MAPAPIAGLGKRAEVDTGKPENPNGLVLEAWAQGYMVGSLIIMAAVTVANMRKGVILHKLILIELIFGMFHGTFIFTDEPVYGWYLSTTAIFLNISWSLHNVIAWMKTRPFLSRKWSLFYIGTVIIAQPYWVIEIAANFLYFNNIYLHLFQKTRPVEALFRDPWWIASTVILFWNIQTRYEMSIKEIITLSPRFGVLLGSMTLSICFIIVDIVSVTGVFDNNALPDGINPFWKLAFIFKCLTDTIILDDFKTALDRLSSAKRKRLNSLTDSFYNSDPLATAAGPKRDDREVCQISNVERDLSRPRDSASLENGNDFSLTDALKMGDDRMAAK